MIRRLIDLWKHLVEVSRYDPEKDLDRWREQLFTVIYPLALLAGLAVCADTLHTAFVEQRFLLTVAACVAYLFVMTLMSLRFVPIRARMAAGLVIFFSSVFYQSSPLVGYLFLFSLPPLIAILVSFHAALSALGANVLLFIATTYHFATFDVDLQNFGIPSLDRWILYGIVFLVLDIIVTLSFGLLTKGLAQVIALEREVRHALMEREKRLTELNTRLSEEMERRERMREELSETERKAAFYLSHDRLTNLPNRAAFLQRLSVEIMRARNRGWMFGVVSIGLDRFKHVNGMYGTAGGDAILNSLAERLRGILRDHDAIGRVGDDRFMLLFSDIARPEDMLVILPRVWETIERPFQIETQEAQVSASIGICFFPLDGTTAEALVKEAEAAMFAVKESGGGAHRFFDAKMNAEMIERVTIERKMRDAIKRDEFIPFFQPKVDRFGYLLGMEALIRWNDSEGIILPDRFIPIAEQNGTIVEIGERVLYHACRQNRQWQENGFVPKKVSVNISPFEFRSPGLVRRIRETVEKSGLDPLWLELEITESGIIRNEQDALRKLRELHEIGISLSIDDFGTGYSALSKLKDYPVDTLKIDKSFIDCVPHDKRAVTIVVSLIRLAHNLGFKVVAEGVERSEQFEFLVVHGCDQFQGYFFGRPLAASEFEHHLHSSTSSS